MIGPTTLNQHERCTFWLRGWVGRVRSRRIIAGTGLSGLVAACELAGRGSRVLDQDQDQDQDQENGANPGGQAYWSFGGLFFVDSPEQSRMVIRLRACSQARVTVVTDDNYVITIACRAMAQDRARGSRWTPHPLLPEPRECLSTLSSSRKPVALRRVANVVTAHSGIRRT
ncbi:FAD-binding protein [Mycobacterium riyadhense]|nr:FAD-binding protein [Mycobacterium riyadhense]